MPSAYPMITDPDRLNFSTELRKPTDQLSETRRKRKSDLERGAVRVSDTLSLRVARSGTKVAATAIRILASHDLITMSAT